MGFKLPNGADLSVEQTDIINLPTTRDWVIKGAPGTGKTVMAIYRAVQAGNVAKGKPVLLLVYNKPLMSFISTAVKEKNVQVKTYYQWLFDEMGSIPKTANDEINWERVASHFSGFGKRYAHIIIDEAQDFPVDLLRILKKISDHMTCFIDPNQAIEVGKTNVIDTIRTLCVESPYKLTKNYRNTKPIRDLSALYCKKGEPAPADNKGKKPVITKCPSCDFEALNAKLVDVIKRNKDKSIGIIVNPKAQNNTYVSLRKMLPSDVIVQMHKPHTPFKIDFDKRGVKIVSYGTMKGLEFDIVLLPMFDKIEAQGDLTVDANRVYVAVSRSISELYLYYWDEKVSPGKIDTLSVLVNNNSLLEWH